MDRRNFLKNSAAAAMVGGVSSAALEACSSKPSMAAGNNVQALVQVYGQLNQTGSRIVDELNFLKRLNIPADIAVGTNYNQEQMAAINAWSDQGNIVSPNLYPNSIDAKYQDSNWHVYDEETCLTLLQKAKEMVLDAGFKRFDAINTYTPGNELIRAAKRIGIHHLTGFCSPTLINDGHWKINHTGAPVVPYFASNEDFRKPEMPSNDQWLQMSSMELRNPLTCLEHWVEGPFGPLNLIMGDRSIEPGDEPVETMCAVTDWLEMSRLTNVPRLIVVNLQYFTSLKCFDLNHQLLTWLAEQRDLGKLRFVGLPEIAELNKAAGGVMPQTTWYRGENMGTMCGGQAGDGCPGIISESINGQVIWRTGQAGPERAYNYNNPWNFPAFDPTAKTPEHSSYTADVKTKQILQDKSVDIELEWDASSPTAVYLCAWEALDGLAAPFNLVSKKGIDTLEIVPHPTGRGGALLFQTSDSSGSARVTIEHNGINSDTFSQRWEELVAAETSIIRGRAVTRFAPLIPARFNVHISLKGNRTARWEAILDGKASSGVLIPGDKLEAIFDGTRMASMLRLWDVTISDLQIDESSIKKEQQRLTNKFQVIASTLAPDCQQPIAPPLFGPERDIPEWSKVAARVGADREIEKVEKARKMYTSGNVVTEYHMACDLPFGSKGRVRSTAYDRSKSTGGIEIFPTFYDYGQSYAPGVAGWTHFYVMTFGIRNHQPGRAYKLVLHTWHPESRGDSLKISAQTANYDVLVRKGKKTELMKIKTAAQGFDERFNSSAFLSINLPPELTKDEAIEIELLGTGSEVKYDRLTEGFGFVFLSHVWLLEEESP